MGCGITLESSTTEGHYYNSTRGLEDFLLNTLHACGSETCLELWFYWSLIGIRCSTFDGFLGYSSYQHLQPQEVIIVIQNLPWEVRACGSETELWSASSVIYVFLGYIHSTRMMKAIKGKKQFMIRLYPIFSFYVMLFGSLIRYFSPHLIVFIV